MHFILKIYKKRKQAALLMFKADIEWLKNQCSCGNMVLNNIEQGILNNLKLTATFPPYIIFIFPGILSQWEPIENAW